MLVVEFKDGFGLRIGELEPFHQHRLWLIFLANDLDDLVNIEECDQQSIEDGVITVNEAKRLLKETTHDRHRRPHPRRAGRG